MAIASLNNLGEEPDGRLVGAGGRPRSRGLVPMRIERSRLAIGTLLAVCLIAGAGGLDPSTSRSWDFESDEVGRIAAGFTASVGRWVVVEDGQNRVLAQQAESPDDTFNLALADGPTAVDLDLSVRLKAAAGKDDQGGGLVWRAQGPKNYYIARYNPLEDNVRVYKVVDGQRTLFQDAKVPGDREWHTLRVAMKGSRIIVHLDGKKHLEVEDATFTQAGWVGLWSKADARTYFDDLILGEAEAR